MALVALGNQQQCELPLTRQKKRGDLLLARVTTADIMKGKGEFERLALKIIDSVIQKSRPSTKSASVSVPQGTLASSILTGALRRVNQLPIIVLKVDVNFTSLQLQQLLVQLKLWGTYSRVAQFIIVLSLAYTGSHTKKSQQVEI